LNYTVKQIKLLLKQKWITLEENSWKSFDDQEVEDWDSIPSQWEESTLLINNKYELTYISYCLQHNIEIKYDNLPTSLTKILSKLNLNQLIETELWHQEWKEKINVYKFDNTTHIRPLHGNEKSVIYCKHKKVLTWLTMMLHDYFIANNISYAVAYSKTENNYGYLFPKDIKHLVKNTSSWSGLDEEFLSKLKKNKDTDKLCKWEMHGKTGINMGIDMYQTIFNTQILLTTSEATSMSVTLNSGRNQFLFEEDTNAGNNKQMQHRVHRFGQQNNVYLYKLETVYQNGSPTLERLHTNKIKEKEALNINTIEGGSVQIKAGDDWNEKDWLQLNAQLKQYKL
jgi:hypothetical protein